MYNKLLGFPIFPLYFVWRDSTIIHVHCQYLVWWRTLLENFLESFCLIPHVHHITWLSLGWFPLLQRTKQQTSNSVLSIKSSSSDFVELQLDFKQLNWCELSLVIIGLNVKVPWRDFDFFSSIACNLGQHFWTPFCQELQSRDTTTVARLDHENSVWFHPWKTVLNFLTVMGQRR